MRSVLMAELYPACPGVLIDLVENEPLREMIHEDSESETKSKELPRP